MRGLVSVALMVLTAAVAEGEEAHLLVDLNRDFASATGSTPRLYAALPDAVLFSARSLPGERDHHQLWRTDGTPAGTRPIAEICDWNSNLSEPLGVVGGVAVFRFASCASDEPSGLWRSDGTATGTYALAVPGRGNPLGDPPGMLATKATSFDGRLYFTSREPETDRHEIWRTDGSIDGTERVAVLAGTDRATWVDEFAVAGGRLLLFLNDGATLEVWRSDGTASGTFRVENPHDLRGESFAVSDTHAFAWLHERPFRLLALDGNVGGVELAWEAPAVRWIARAVGSPSGIAFVANLDPDGRTQIWHSDGRPGGAVAWTAEYPSTRGIRGGSEWVPTLAFLGTRLFFLVDLSETEVGIYSTDGSPDSVRLVESLPRRAGDPSPWIVAVGGRLFFPKVDSSGLELWVSDGRAGGGRRAVDACPGSCDGRPSSATVVGSRLFWVAHETGDGMSLWITEGAGATTSTRVAQGLRQPGCLVRGEGRLPLLPVADRWIFPAQDFVHGCEPWAAREAPDSGEILGDLLVDQPGLSNLEPAVADGDQTYLVARRASPSQGDVVLATDGRSPPVVQFEAPTPGCAWRSASPSARVFPLSRAVVFVEQSCMGELSVFARPQGSEELVQLFGRSRLDRPGVEAIYPAPDPTSGLYLAHTGSLNELWFTDGTEEGTARAATPISFGRFLGQIGDRILAWDAAYGAGTYFSLFDMTTWQAWVLLGPQAGSIEDGPIGRDARGRISFRFRSWATSQFELWRTDGTAEGTVALFRPTAGEALVAAIPWGADLVYSMRQSSGRVELRWIRDGSLSSELLWSAEGALQGLGVGTGLRALEHGFLFFGWDPTFGVQNWFFSPQTGQATRLTGKQSTNPLAIQAVARWHAYLSRHMGGEERDLWRTDGTAAGTIRLGDWDPSLFWSEREMAIVDEHLYYVFDDGVHGRELWASDGTATGTRLLADIVPGPVGSEPRDLTLANHTLYFTADDGIHGREIWTIPAGHAPPRRR